MADESAKLTILAPAKVNLTLEILGRRSDGYHELDSILAPLDLCDELELTATAGSGLTLTVEECDGATFGGRAPPPEDNLILRAARLLREECGEARGAAILLRKRIPVGGGLGGGSADAAAALLGLNRLWALNLSTARLLELGARLGSDVPALVLGRVCRMRGRGERVTPLFPEGASHPPWWLVLANPGFPVPTRDVYARLRMNSGLTPSPNPGKDTFLALEMGDVERGVRDLRNALQPVVFAKYPLLAVLEEALTEAGALRALLSGSGASVFGVVRDEGRAREVERRLRMAMGPWLWTRAARLLPDGVMVAHGPLEARV